MSNLHQMAMSTQQAFLMINNAYVGGYVNLDKLQGLPQDGQDLVKSMVAFDESGKITAVYVQEAKGSE
jgi:hypothetical protein